MAEQALDEKLNELKETTKRRLAELVHIRVILKSIQEKMQDRQSQDASGISCELKNRDFHNLSGVFDEIVKKPKQEGEDYGHRFNKMFIVYAASILEDYIRTVFDKTANSNNKNYTGVIRAAALTGVLGKIKCAGIKNFPDKKNDNPPLYYTYFLGRLRNCIVHKDGKPDDVFWNGKTKYDPCVEDLLCEPFLECWKKNCPRDGGKTHNKLWLDFDEVIFFLLDNAIDLLNKDDISRWAGELAARTQTTNVHHKNPKPHIRT